MLYLLAILLTVVSMDAASQQVYRCGNAYTHEPCKGGREIDTSPPVVNQSGPSTTLIYLCRAGEGALYWIPEHCVKRGWTIERIERVPANVPFEHQLASARSQRAEAASITASPTVSQSNYSNVPTRKAQCAAFDAEIKQLDAMGRAGSLHYNLDWIRDRRREVRDVQFRMRC